MLHTFKEEFFPRIEKKPSKSDEGHPGIRYPKREALQKIVFRTLFAMCTS